MLRGERGLTLIELVVATALLAILATAALPLYTMSIKREREIELRYALRTIRRAIDLFHDSYVASGGKTDCSFSTGGAGSAAQAQLQQQQLQQMQQMQQAQAAGQRGRPGQPGMPGMPGMGVQPEVPLIDASQFDPCESRGYPPTLKILVEGVQAQGGGTDDKDKVKFLRRIPLDPMVAHQDYGPADDNFGWGVRSYQDAADAVVWGRQNVWDVYTKGGGKALDGSSYKEW